MRFQHSISALLFAAATAAAKPQVCGNGDSACVFTFDPDRKVGIEGHRLEPQEARLVLAQRVGAEEYHLSSALDRQELDSINTYGVRNTLFGSEKNKERVLVFYEASEEDQELNLAVANGRFSIDSSPSGEGLFDDLSQQSKAQFNKASSLDELKAIFESFAQTGKHVTALITSKDSKVEQTKWGSYEMPGAQSPLRKISKRQTQKEVPLSELPSDAHSSAAAAVVHSAKTPVSVFAGEEDGPLAGILPGCFRSQSSCENSTRSCSGHGSCYRKFTDQHAEGSAKPECWTCQCKATKSQDGKLTSYWGGSACQKQDISVSFWLITLFTVGLVSLVSFAIGTIWSMGNEELPSVIGAGVSGPPRR